MKVSKVVIQTLEVRYQNWFPALEHITTFWYVEQSIDGFSQQKEQPFHGTTCH
jgi:hypothetical protein